MDALYPQFDEFLRFGGVDLKQVVLGLARERDLPNLTERLVERGWPEADIRKVVYENPLAFWRQANNWKEWPPEPSLNGAAAPQSAKAY